MIKWLLYDFWDLQNLLQTKQSLQSKLQKGSDLLEKFFCVFSKDDSSESATPYFPRREELLLYQWLLHFCCTMTDKQTHIHVPRLKPCNYILNFLYPGRGFLVNFCKKCGKCGEFFLKKCGDRGECGEKKYFTAFHTQIHRISNKNSPHHLFLPN